MQIRRRIERFRAEHLRVLRWLVPLLWAAVAVLAALWIGSTLQVVTVHSDKGTRVLLTASRQPQQWVAEAGFAAGPEDELKITHTADGAVLDILTAFTVTVQADGEKQTFTATGGTVADMLKRASVQLGPDDYTQPAQDTALTGSITVRVFRVEYVEELRRDSITPQQLEAYLAGRSDGSDFMGSSDGATYDVLYRDKLVDGKVADSEILELTAVFLAPTPRPSDSYSFQNGVPNSRIENYDDISFGPDGLPLGYARVMKGAVATAYSASRGRGSSGLGLYCGTVAVNPNVIPYGTRMWITDHQQNFVYGFAIATDTGTAMMEGRVDIDLFFETNAECLQFGKRQLDVYIFSPPPKEEAA